MLLHEAGGKSMHKEKCINLEFPDTGLNSNLARY